MPCNTTVLRIDTVMKRPLRGEWARLGDLRTSYYRMSSDIRRNFLASRDSTLLARLVARTRGRGSRHRPAWLGNRKCRASEEVTLPPVRAGVDNRR